MPPSVIDAPDLSGLIELSRDPGLDLKPVILRVQTDLFLAAPIRDRKALRAFESLATGLIPTVDEETAAIVARKLGPCPDTPSSVLMALAARGGAVAETRADILAQTLAERAARAAAVPPAPEGVDEADRARAANPGILLDSRTLARLITGARRDPQLAHTLLARPDLPAGELAPLWLHADPDQRRAIAEAVEATAALRPCPPPPRALADALTGHAAQADIGAFIATLSEGLGLPNGFVGAAPDPSTRYDLLTLALRAAGLREADAVYVFLTLNEAVARSVDRVFLLVDLFTSLSRGAARDLLGAILDVPLPDMPRGEHQPYHAADTAKARGSAVERPAARPALPGRTRRTG